jgi:hypothetical protein
MTKIPCSFCNTLNDAAEKNCVGCGAPLDAPAPRPVSPPQTFQQPVQSAQASSPFDTMNSQKLQDSAQQVEKLYAGAVGVYQTAWSVTSDAIAITLAAFAIGVAGGATGMGFWGVLGAMLVGLVVGYTEQSFWVNIVASPAGALMGIVVWSIVWAAGGGSKGMVFVATGLACIGALVGAHQRTKPLGCSTLVRPLLGAVGGFFFAILGLAIGAGIRAIL